MAPGARAGHVPGLQTKRESRHRAGRASSRPGGVGNAGTRPAKGLLYGGGSTDKKRHRE